MFDSLDFFPYIFSEIFSRAFLIFFQTFKNCPGLPKFFTDLPKIFPIPTKNVIFLATFHKFLQFCLSNSDVSTTFGHFSQKSPLCRRDSYTHGCQRLMVSTEIIKNWGGGAKWGAENNFGGHLPPPSLPPPHGAATEERIQGGWQSFLKGIAMKVIFVPFKSTISICFKTFYRFLISFLIYKISRFA